MTRDELIACLARADEGTRELDFWCWWYGVSTEAGKPDPKPPDTDYVRDKMDGWTCGPSRSVDWALKMVPDGWFVWRLNEDVSAMVHLGDRHDPTGFYDACLQWRAAGGRLIVSRGRTMALALCMSALNARRCDDENLRQDGIPAPRGFTGAKGR